MLFSAIIAFFVPFELFLFVYAVLGPLHYLTEINWLKQKNFFLPNKNDYLILLIPTILLVLFRPIKFNYYLFLLFFTFIGSFGLVLIKNNIGRLTFLIAVLLIGILISNYNFYWFKLIFTVFLPSVVHVFIFTALFIVLGALKLKSKTAILSLILFIVCAIFLLTFNNILFKSHLTNYIISSYAPFRGLNNKLISLFSYFHFYEIKDNWYTLNNIHPKEYKIFHSAIGLKIMSFIAFAYTYHYLNWFSKTSLIQWHKTSSLKLIAILVVWFLSITVYIYDYNMGLKWLFLLSLVHVILEFPLNHLSLIEIKKHLINK